MINISISISNPFSHRFSSVYNKVWKIREYKYLEVEVIKDSAIASGCLRITTRQSHAGIYCSVGLLGWDIGIEFYDSRHWDSKNNCWETYP